MNHLFACAYNEGPTNPNEDATMNWLDRNLNACVAWTFGTLAVLTLILAAAIISVMVAAVAGYIPWRS